MAELRSVDPRILQPNPDNPRRTPVSPAMDEQLLASIKAIGIIQPPIVVQKDGALVINAGDRRVKQAIRADFATIDVLVCDADEARDLMRSLAENLIRASMNSVDIWRAIDTLEKKGWNEQAIADALALPLRTVKRLKLLAHLHPPMLDAIAAGSTPTEDQLRTIAAASLDEQAQVWKKHKPKKGHEASWYEIARALAKRRIPFSRQNFGDDLAQAYGVVWEDDLFAPAGEDGRYTTNVDGFFGAQQEWLQNNLPERGTLLPQDEYGRPQLPKKAENVYGTPGKNDRIGHYLDPYSGAVKTLVYRLPDGKKAKPGKDPAGTAPDPEAPEPKTRPDVTQKGLAMIGDFSAARKPDRGHYATRAAGAGTRRQERFRSKRRRHEPLRPREDRRHDHRRRRPHLGLRADPHRCPEHARRRALMPRQHVQQRPRSAHRRRSDRRVPLPADDGHRRVPLLPLAAGAGEGSHDGRRAGRGPRARYPRPVYRALHGYALRLPERPLPGHCGRDRRRKDTLAEPPRALAQRGQECRLRRRCRNRRGHRKRNRCTRGDGHGRHAARGLSLKPPGRSSFRG